MSIACLHSLVSQQGQSGQSNTSSMCTAQQYCTASPSGPAVVCRRRPSLSKAVHIAKQYTKTEWQLCQTGNFICNSKMPHTRHYLQQALGGNAPNVG